MPVGALHRRLGSPATHYQMHHAAMDGLPTKLAADLAHELGLGRIVGRNITSPSRHVSTVKRDPLSPCRILDALLELYNGNLDEALRWPTSPNLTLASERPVDLLVTEPGFRAVLHLIHPIEHGLHV